MFASQHRTAARARVLFLVALLLVPVALSGHFHVGAGSTHPCAACAVVHHAPIASTPTLPTFASRIVHTVVVALAPVAPSRTDQAPGAGRAPPRPSTTLVA